MTGRPCGQPELPGGCSLPCSPSFCLWKDPPPPNPAHTTPARPLPRASLQKPSRGQRHCPTTEEDRLRPGAGSRHVPGPAPALSPHRAGFLGPSQQRTDIILGQFWRPKVRDQGVPSVASLACRWPSFPLCFTPSSLCASLCPSSPFIRPRSHCIQTHPNGLTLTQSALSKSGHIPRC